MELRAHCNISPAQLAGALGVTRGIISDYVHGRSNVPTEQLEALARPMYCEVSDLHMPPGSPLPRLRFRPRRLQNAQPSSNKIDFNTRRYLPVAADETI
jgi:transcriptional regulator with XRE-family HTH domain